MPAVQRVVRGGVLAVLSVLVSIVVVVLGAVVPASAAADAGSDSFTRTVSGGLGTADAGGGWTLGGTASRFAVGGGTARLSTPAGGSLTGTLAGTSIRDADVAATVGLTALPAGGSAYLGVHARRGGSGEYSASAVVSAAGAVSISLMAGGTQLTAASVPGLTVAASSGVRLRLQVTGANPTTVRARAWKPGTAEPTTWAATTTDATAGLQGAGSVGIGAYVNARTTNGPLVVTVDDFAAAAPTPAGPPPTNTAPTASLTATPAGLTVAFDGTGSTDPDGTITGYAWTFGDGTTGTGPRPSHTYPAAGSYAVGLTVTDNGGKTATAGRTVTVTAPAGNRAPVPVLLEQSVAQTTTFRADRSSDPDGSVTGYAWAFGDGTTGSGPTVAHSYAAPGTYTATLTVTDDGGASASASRTVFAYRSGTTPTQAQWLADVSAAMDGGLAYLDANATVPRRAIVLDIDNTSLQSYYGDFAATPAVLAFEQRAVADGYAVLVATGRSADTGGSAWQLYQAGYQVDSLCFLDPAAGSTQASKTACRAAWAAQGYTIVANVGNYSSDIDGANSGRPYLLPHYNLLD